MVQAQTRRKHSSCQSKQLTNQVPKRLEGKMEVFLSDELAAVMPQPSELRSIMEAFRKPAGGQGQGTRS